MPLSQEARKRLIIALTDRIIGKEVADYIDVSIAIVPEAPPIAGTALTFNGTGYVWSPNDIDPLSLHLNGGNSPTADISWDGNKITDLGAPTDPNDAATKDYVDTAASAGANNFLSNLTSPTAINQDLLFGTDGVSNVGASLANRPANAYIRTTAFIGGPSGGTVRQPDNTDVDAVAVPQFAIRGGSKTGGGTGTGGNILIQAGSNSTGPTTNAGRVSVVGGSGNSTGTLTSSQFLASQNTGTGTAAALLLAGGATVNTAGTAGALILSGGQGFVGGGVAGGITFGAGGTTVPGTRRLEITKDGNHVMSLGALATAATDGFYYTASMPGVPTGVPTAFTGRNPYAFNSSDNILYLYNSGWKEIGSVLSSLSFLTDGIGNIGAVGASRPDNAYIKTQVTVGDDTTSATEVFAGYVLFKDLGSQRGFIAEGDQEFPFGGNTGINLYGGSSDVNIGLFNGIVALGQFTPSSGMDPQVHLIQNRDMNGDWGSPDAGVTMKRPRDMWLGRDMTIGRWLTVNSGLLDNAGFFSIITNDRHLTDSTEVISANWENRVLVNASGTNSVDWSVSGLLTAEAKLELNSGMLWNRRTVADADDTLTATDFVVAFTSLTASRTATLPTPTAALEGQVFVIKDESGNAGTFNIIISGTVDGGSISITANYGVARVYCSGAAYFTF